MTFIKGLSITSIAAAMCITAGAAGQGDCPTGEIADCDGSGECWTEAWVADGFCDGTAQQYGADLCCYPEPGGNDGGDCTAEECAPGAFACCTDQGCSEVTEEECAAQGGTFNAGVLCAAFPCGFLENCGDANTNGQPCTEPSADGTTGCADGLCCSTVCLIDSICCEDGGEWDSVCVGYADTACGIGGCQPGEIVDCDGTGECWPEGWIADTFCDGSAQVYGADLCCYPEAGGNDGGDCTEDECAPVVCGDGICATGAEDPTTCPEDCGDGSECATVTATNGDQDFDQDGTNDLCYLDPTTGVESGYITLTWAGNCLAETVEFAGLGTLGPGSYASPLTVVGLGANQDCYDITLTFAGGATSDVINGCVGCGEPPACGDGVCNGDETFDTCPDDCLPPGECPAGQIVDCDGSNECHPDTWVADTFCDGTDQQYGADLCCYDGGTPGNFDGGDCTAEECAGGGGPVCGDGVCDAGEDETSCPADCEVVVVCPYDLTGDLVIGGGDLTVLLAAWATADAAADFNNDGVVGGGDLTLLLASWGVVCE
ncbi:MAG: hypothetical protein VX684_08630 [Planctomycetota bacterium]|nr:hypothetical protein [Planctomycetota bacterium]MED5507891.1 hypothetical protein [Planctomycetota bacterium]